MSLITYLFIPQKYALGTDFFYFSKSLVVSFTLWQPLDVGC